MLRWRWLISSSLILGGCAHYQAAPLIPERSVQEFAARSLPAQQQWDRAALLSLALKQNPELAVARAEIQAAAAHEITAAELPNPDVTLQSENGLLGIGSYPAEDDVDPDD